jgi:hypothetical protein
LQSLMCWYCSSPLRSLRSSNILLGVGIVTWDGSHHCWQADVFALKTDRRQNVIYWSHHVGCLILYSALPVADFDLFGQNLLE